MTPKNVFSARPRILVSFVAVCALGGLSPGCRPASSVRVEVVRSVLQLEAPAAGSDGEGTAQGGASRGLAYLVLRSRGRDAELRSVRLVHGQAHIRTHAFENGVALTPLVPSLRLPADREIVMRPGGIHVFVEGLKDTLKPGQSLEMTLVFADGSQLETSVPVSPPPANGPRRQRGDR